MVFLSEKSGFEDILSLYLDLKKNKNKKMLSSQVEYSIARFEKTRQNLVLDQLELMYIFIN